VPLYVLLIQKYKQYYQVNKKEGFVLKADNDDQGYINKTWGVPLTPKDRNARLDEWSNIGPRAINKNHVHCRFTSYSNKFGYQLALR